MWIFTSLLLILNVVQILSSSPPAPVPTFNVECANDFAKTCLVQCRNGNYLLDDKGCPTCACASGDDPPPVACPLMKCRANCGSAGYQRDENGCQTCKCAAKADVQCSRVMCRMFCKNGFKRDDNGCEYCACNEEPTPCPTLTCTRQCANGYRKDYSGCPTCDCNEEQERTADGCLKLACDLTCTHGLQRDESGCPRCACNRCPLQLCRMFCPSGFKRNEQGCQVCECNWNPVDEVIKCNERNPCVGDRVCKLETNICENVDPDKVAWFVFDFDIRTDMFQDARFVQAFREGFIKNVAARYDLSIGQVSVSAVEENGLTSFQIKPYLSDDPEEFERKIDQIDVDLNSYDFRAVLPAVAQAIESGEQPYRPRTLVGSIGDRLRNFTRRNTRLAISMLVLLLIATAFIIGFIYLNTSRRRLAHRSGSKVPIFDSSYQQAPTDDDSYHAVHAPDGTAYVVVETDDVHSSTNKRTLV